MRWWTAVTLQVLLGLLFLFSAYSKLSGGAEEIRLGLGIPAWFWAVTAAVEVVGAAALLSGISRPRLAVFGGLWLGATMLCGAVAHLRAGDGLLLAAPALVLMLFALAVAAMRSSDARLGALLGTPDRDAARPHAVTR
jgi:hypothetical protein